MVDNIELVKSKQNLSTFIVFFLPTNIKHLIVRGTIKHVHLFSVMASRESGNLSGGGGVAATAAAAVAAAGTSPHQQQQQQNPTQAPMTAAGAGGSVGSLPAGGSQATVAAAGGGATEGAGRVSNVQRIQQKKAQVRAWPRDKKLEKLAIYSACKVSVTAFCLCACVPVVEVLLPVLILYKLHSSSHAYYYTVGQPIIVEFVCCFLVLLSMEAALPQLWWASLVALKYHEFLFWCLLF